MYQNRVENLPTACAEWTVNSVEIGENFLSIASWRSNASTAPSRWRPANLQRGNLHSFVTSIDSSWKSLQFCFWVQVDWMNRSTVNSKKSRQGSVSPLAATVVFSELRPNVFSNRIALKRLLIENSKSYKTMCLMLKLHLNESSNFKWFNSTPAISWFKWFTFCPPTWNTVRHNKMQKRSLNMALDECGRLVRISSNLNYFKRRAVSRKWLKPPEID